MFAPVRAVFDAAHAQSTQWDLCGSVSMSQAEIKPGVLSWSPILIGHRLQLPKARTDLVWDYQSTTRVFLKIPSLCLLLEVFSGGRGGGHLKPFTTNLAQKFLRVHLKLNFWSDEQNWRLKNNLTWGSVFLKCFFGGKKSDQQFEASGAQPLSQNKSAPNDKRPTGRQQNGLSWFLPILCLFRPRQQQQN